MKNLMLFFLTLSACDRSTVVVEFHDVPDAGELQATLPPGSPIGGFNEPCYANGTCDTASDPSLVCYVSPDSTTGAKTCGRCGTYRGPCCEGQQCGLDITDTGTQGLSCQSWWFNPQSGVVVTTEFCNHQPTCGLYGQPCCGEVCNDGSTCSLPVNTKDGKKMCGSCGGKNQPCCVGGQCDEGLCETVGVRFGDNQTIYENICKCD